MEFKNVIKKIMENKELRLKLNNLDNFDEVYGFFVANGYEESKDQLKESLFKTTDKLKSLSDEDLLAVGGGVSGRQVLSACAGLMMLMGVSPFKDSRGYAINTPLH
ncbi:MAG: hypothetical protein IKE41_03480, partial [Clostridia bacterium]|nr:hypothetical protein [Clostridia bacterium]